MRFNVSGNPWSLLKSSHARMTAAWLKTSSKMTIPPTGTFKAYAAAEATAEKRLIARAVISDARNRGLRRGPGLERNATAWAYLRARSAGRLAGRLVGFFWASILFSSVLHAAS